MLIIVLIIEIAALSAILVSDNSKTGYAIRCVADGALLGVAATHLIPGTELYIGTTLDIVLNIVYAFGFAFFSYGNYKCWKNAK